MLDEIATTLDGLMSRLNVILTRIADALDPGGRNVAHPDLSVADAFVWHPERGALVAIESVARIPMELLKGIERSRDLLLANTLRFAHGLPANNALLWGARGMGKSSLVKALHAHIQSTEALVKPLILVELQREDVASVSGLLDVLRNVDANCILFCDDLSFDYDDAAYKALKAVLDGGLRGRPANVIFYATSNRRHLVPRDMVDNERHSAINPNEAIDEKVSLSDRFGLWLGFHRCNQDQYLEMIAGYAQYLGVAASIETLRPHALEWATTRGSRSGRVAWQFAQEWAGREGLAKQQEK